MEVTCHLSFGDYSGSDYAAQLFMVLLVHGWGNRHCDRQDSRLDPDPVQACIIIAEEMTQFRSAGVFGESLSVSPDVDPRTNLLVLLGRRS